MAYTNFKPTIWSTHIQQQLEKMMVTRMFCNTKFQGEAGRGKTVKIVGIGRPTVRTYVPGTAIVTPETPSDTTQTLSIDQYDYTNFAVDDVDAAQAHVDIMKYLMDGSAKGLSEKADAYVLGKFADAGTVTDSTAITNGDELKKEIDKGFVKLWDEGVTIGSEVYIVVSPWAYDLLKDKIVNLLTTNNDVVYKGIVGMYNGAKVLLTNNIAKDSADDLLGITTKEAVAFAGGIDSVEAYRPEDQFSDAVKALHTYGAKVVRPEQIYTIKAHKA